MTKNVWCEERELKFLKFNVTQEQIKDLYSIKSFDWIEKEEMKIIKRELRRKKLERVLNGKESKTDIQQEEI